MKQQTSTMSDAAHTAKMLSEALPYLQRYSGAVVVVKFGGNAMGDDAAMAEFARDIVLMRQVGVNPVVVHGGGPMINDMLTKLGIKSEFVRGKRVTDKATVQVVEMILSGLVNKRIVQAINDQGGRAVGISGKDDDLMVCVADDPELGGRMRIRGEAQPGFVVLHVPPPHRGPAQEEALCTGETVNHRRLFTLEGNEVGLPGNSQTTKVTDVFTNGELAVHKVARHLLRGQRVVLINE